MRTPATLAILFLPGCATFGTVAADVYGTYDVVYFFRGPLPQDQFQEISGELKTDGTWAATVVENRDGRDRRLGFDGRFVFGGREGRWIRINILQRDGTETGAIGEVCGRRLIFQDRDGEIMIWERRS